MRVDGPLLRNGRVLATPRSVPTRGDGARVGTQDWGRESATVASNPEIKLKVTLFRQEGLSGLAHTIHTMSSDKKRVQFRAPHRLIDRADTLAEVLGEDRTDILVTALREYLQEAAHDDALTQEIAAAYYDDEITVEQLKTLVGAEEAANFRVLKQQLDEEFIDEVADT